MNHAMLTAISILIAGAFVIVIPSAFAQPCVNTGSNILGPKDGKQIQNQENQCTVTSNSVNQPPIANAGPNQVVSPGSLVTLDGTRSFDPDGDRIVAYSWVQTSGISVSLNGANTATPTFTAPSISSGTTLTFSLTVTDSAGAVSSPATVVITVNGNNVNQPPIANAGPSQTVSQGSFVTLVGTGSFSPNAGATIVSYSWTQTSGTPVSLNGANTATPTFTAPTGTTSLTFSLTVTDSTGAVSSPSTVTITVS
jgi:large repetitive protein